MGGNEKINRFRWIDNLKLVAAWGIALGHLMNALAVGEKHEFFALSKTINFYLLSGILNGELWVVLFCMISGYLLARKKITTLENFFFSVFQRYFRFVIPLFFANLFAYVIYCSIGYYTAKCGGVLDNTWIASMYNTSMSFCSVIKNSITLGNQLNSTLWVIRHMYIASCLIYLTKYVSFRLRKDLFVLEIVVSVLMICCPYTSFIGCCYIGMCLEKMSKMCEENSLFQNVLFVLMILCVFMMCGGQSWIAYKTGLNILKMNLYWEVFYVLIFLLSIFINVNLKCRLEFRILNGDGAQASFSLYMIHWPIICSVSMWEFLLLYSVTSAYLTSYVVTLLVSIVIIAILSDLYGKYVGKLEKNILGRLNLILSKREDRLIKRKL